MIYFPLLWRLRTPLPEAFAPGERWFYRMDSDPIDLSAVDLSKGIKALLGVHATPFDINDPATISDVSITFHADLKLDNKGITRQIELTKNDTIIYPNFDSTRYGLEISIVLCIPDGTPGFLKTESYFKNAKLDLQTQTLEFTHALGKDNSVRLHSGLVNFVLFTEEESDKFFFAEKDQTLADRNEFVDKRLSLFGFLENDRREIARKGGVKPPQLTKVKATQEEIQNSLRAALGRINHD